MLNKEVETNQLINIFVRYKEGRMIFRTCAPPDRYKHGFPAEQIVVPAERVGIVGWHLDLEDVTRTYGISLYLKPIG